MVALGGPGYQLFTKRCGAVPLRLHSAGPLSEEVTAPHPTHPSARGVSSVLKTGGFLSPFLFGRSDACDVNLGSGPET